MNWHFKDFKLKYFSVQCSPIFMITNSMIKGSRLHSFVLLVKASCRWRFVWSISGMTTTRENGSTRKNAGPSRVCSNSEFHNIKVWPYSTKWWNTGEGQRRVSTLSLTSTIDGTGWLTPHSGHFTPREESLVHILQEAEWASGPVWWVQKILVPTGFEPQTVRPVAIRYTDSDIPAAES